MDQILILIGGALIGLVGKIIYDIFLVERRKSLRKVLKYECDLWEKYIDIGDEINNVICFMKNSSTRRINHKTFRMYLKEVSNINFDELDYVLDDIIIRLNSKQEHRDFFNIWKRLLVNSVDIFIELNKCYEDVESGKEPCSNPAMLNESIIKENIEDIRPNYDAFMERLYLSWDLSILPWDSLSLNRWKKYIDESKKCEKTKFFHLMDKFREEGFDKIIEDATLFEKLNYEVNENYRNNINTYKLKFIIDEIKKDVKKIFQIRKQHEKM